jgi:hypothetical protein
VPLFFASLPEEKLVLPKVFSSLSALTAPYIAAVDQTLDDLILGCSFRRKN